MLLRMVSSLEKLSDILNLGGLLNFGIKSYHNAE